MYLQLSVLDTHGQLLFVRSMKPALFGLCLRLAKTSELGNMGRPELYFPKRSQWREWLLRNHATTPHGVDLIFYRVNSKQPSMKWTEAVQEALCFGWIDSTVKKIDNDKRRQYFCPRKCKSSWSKVNKQHIEELERDGLLHESGRVKIEEAKLDGSWSNLDDVEEGIVPDDLRAAFEQHPEALKNFKAFAKSYRKSYLRWLNGAKREATRQKRIEEILRCCAENKKKR